MAGKIRFSVFAFAWILFVPTNGFAADPTQVLQIRGKTMGTTYQIKFVFKESHPVADFGEKELQNEIDDRLVAINQSMSTYISDSEISRFNALRSTESFKVSNDFLAVASKAMDLHKKTSGKFDVTVGPLVRFWGFGGGMSPDKIPTQSQVETVLKRVGAEKIKLSENSIQKEVIDLEIDFSAIAKGYAVDEVAEILSKYSECFMVEIGGEVRTFGTNPDSGQNWAIGIERPKDNPLVVNRDLAARVELADQALATSGDYRNFVIIEGKKFQHTIDPTTGFPVDRGILSVSVVAKDCMTADGLATGMMVQSVEQIKTLCAAEKISAFVIFRNQEGEIAWWKSENFPGQEFMNDQKQQVSTTGNETAEKNQTNPLYLVLGTVIVFGLAISGMAIGVIMSNRQLKGSCGGLSAMNKDGSADASPCSLCTKPATECTKKMEQQSSESAPVE